MDRIFSIWPTLAALAGDLGVKYPTVAAWKRRGSIPAKFDMDVREYARRRGARVTLEELANARRDRRLVQEHMGVRSADRNTRDPEKMPAKLGNFAGSQ